MTNIAHEEIKSARKSHRCDWCNEDIAIGEPYVRQRNKDGADVWTWRAHPECVKASAKLSSWQLECCAHTTQRRGCICERGDKLTCDLCGRDKP